MDWHDKASRSSVEMSDSKSRPALYSKLGSLAEYDTIYMSNMTDEDMLGYYNQLKKFLTKEGVLK